MGSHRDETGPHKSLEESVLENIDAAVASAQAPANKAFEKLLTIQKVVIAGIIFVVVFAATTTYSLIRINNIADENQQYLEDTCVSGNTSRASELTFWLAIFAESAKDPANQTPARVAQRELYLKKLYNTYPQVDCTKVKSGERVVVPPKVVLK